MILGAIYNLKDIGAEHLLRNKCQPYTEGVESALGEYNSIIMRVHYKEIEMRIKMKLALAYADMENAENNAEEVFLLGKIDFFEYILDYNNRLIGYSQECELSQECEGTFKIKDGNVTEIDITGIALIPRERNGS